MAEALPEITIWTFEKVCSNNNNILFQHCGTVYYRSDFCAARTVPVKEIG